MSRRRALPQPESRAKAEESGRSAAAPMDKFNDLARKLVNVSREELHREQERYDVENAARRQRKQRKE